MFKKGFLLIFLLVTSISYSQSLNKLDQKNGFRNFILGSAPSSIKNIVKKDYDSSFPNVTNYSYTGNDLKELFGIKVTEIDLGFYKNKLFSIRIDFGDIGNSFELHEYNKIKGLLEESYGKDWFNAINDDGIIINGCIWNAKNVKLELLRIDFKRSKSNPQNYGYISGYIHVMDKKLMQDMYNNSF